MYSQDFLIPLSALQHLLFCERQCALIHIERAWEENYLTMLGELFHARVDSLSREKRKEKVQEFALPIRSLELGLIGKADSVEFYRDDGGAIQRIIPVEYKRGKKKKEDWDRVQLCAQALCLEEMLGLSVSTGYLFYGTERRREEVLIDQGLRDKTIDLCYSLHQLIDSGITPPATMSPKCKSCSLLLICRPDSVGRGKSAARYLAQMTKEDSIDEAAP